MSVDKSAECRQNAENDLPGSSLCQNGKQVEIITKMIFELCYIEAITLSMTGFNAFALSGRDCSYT